MRPPHAHDDPWEALKAEVEAVLQAEEAAGRDPWDPTPDPRFAPPDPEALRRALTEDQKTLEE